MNWTNEKGTSLVEITLMLALLGILGYASAPYLGSADAQLSLDGATKKLESDLRYAQNMATTTSDTYGFETLTDGEGNQDYRIYMKDANGVKTTAPSPQTHEDMEVDLSDSYSDVAFGTPDDPEDYVIEFDKTGAPTTGGGTTITLSVPDGTTKQISIASGTGNINILTN